MQFRILIVISIILNAAIPSIAQTALWRAFTGDQKHLVHLQAGWDYGLTAGIGYGYRFQTRMPMTAHIEYSMPAGENTFDDYKVRVGGQIELIRRGGFSVSGQVYCPWRRYENSHVRMANFGGEFTGLAGYYRPRWFMAAEFGIDKAIATHIRHKTDALAYYPDRVDGWYVPTGGNYHYGLLAGVSFGKNDLVVKGGRLVSQGFETRPFIPQYAQLSVQRRF